MVKNKSLYTKRTFFANKVLLGFDDDVILQFGTNLLTLKDVFYDIDLRSNLYKERKDDTIQARSKYELKITTRNSLNTNELTDGISYVGISRPKSPTATIYR